MLPSTEAPIRAGPPFDVAILGGGIVGCAIARSLARYHLRLALVEAEAEVGFGTTKANSGIIHGGHHASPTTLKGRLEWAGNQQWGPLAAELGFGFRRIGELTVAANAEQQPALDALLQHAAAKGIPGLELWPAERIRSAEPALTGELHAGVYAPSTAVINPYEACFALAASAARNGVTIFTSSRVMSLALREGIWEIGTTRSALAARFVVNAAGLYADQIAELAGVRTFTIHARKGEEFLLDKRLQGLVRHVIFPVPTPTSKGILLIPTYDGTLMVGPTAHSTEDKTELTTSAAGAAEVFAAVQRLAPGISRRDIIAQFAGLRAAADGEDFIIGPTAARGFLNAAGIQSPGLTAAPAIAELMVDLLATEGLPLSARDGWVPEPPPPVHFAALARAEQQRLAAADPGYARIVCRCEFVTEGEVREALARGATTLDGIKFRTRAGMGRCQGGFCTARCMELLARAQGIPLTRVTKRGGDSWLVCTRAAEEVSP